MNLSETIKSARENLGLTQEELAEQCDVSRQAVSKWELGASVPSPENLALLSELLGVSLDAEDAEPEAPGSLSAPAPKPGGRTAWKTAAIALAMLMAAALLSIWLYFFLLHRGALTEPEPLPVEPAVTGIWFCGEDGTPLEPDKGDGWNQFPVGQRVYLLAAFQQGTEIGVQGVSLFATPTGTEVYDQREQLALQTVYDRTCALFPLDFPEATMLHLDVVLECDLDRRITETVNVAAVSPELFDPAFGETADPEG